MIVVFLNLCWYLMQWYLNFLTNLNFRWIFYFKKIALLISKIYEKLKFWRLLHKNKKMKKLMLRVSVCTCIYFRCTLKLRWFCFSCPVQRVARRPSCTLRTRVGRWFWNLDKPWCTAYYPVAPQTPHLQDSALKG